MKALVLIDLQNEFLDLLKGRYPILESSKANLLQNLRLFIPKFRQDGGKIIWIQSKYSVQRDESREAVVEDPDGDDNFLRSTHRGKTPCCEAGSQGREIYSELLQMVDKGKDEVVIKKWFSAFKETDLAELLKSTGVGEVYFAGVLSNVCVLATMSESVDHPWETFVVTDCLGFRKEKSHSRALERMAEMGVSFIQSGDSPHTPIILPVRKLLPKLYYVNGSIPSWRVFIALYTKGIEFEGMRMKVMSIPKPTREPEFLAISPRGKTPVFIDNDSNKTRVNESLAVLQYLEQYYPETQSLLPPLENRSQRARVWSLMQESESLHHTYDVLEDGYWEAKKVKTLTNFADDVRPKLIDDINSELEFWESYLNSSQEDCFIAGTEDMTLADCAFFPLIAYMMHRGFVFGGKWKGLERYYQRMWKLECVRRAMPDKWDVRGGPNVFHSP